MRPDGKIERHDELLNSVFYRDRNDGKRDTSADIPIFYGYIREALMLHQGFYVPHPLNGMSGFFPFAWYLREGMKVYDTDNNVDYKIEEVQKDTDNNPTGYVKLSGGNGLVPTSQTRLQFDPSDTLVFMHAFPKTFAPTYKFADDGSGRLSTEYTYPWRDTVTWSVARKEVGTLDGQPFQGTRNARPMHRESLTFGPDQTYSVTTSGQWFDTVFQFDCWAKTGVTAERLVNWFEGFMELYRGVFRYNGINNLLYWDRARDEFVTRWRDDIVNATVRYYVRMENVVAILEDKIRVIYALFHLGTGTVDAYASGFRVPTGYDPDTIPVGVYESHTGLGGY